MLLNNYTLDFDFINHNSWEEIFDLEFVNSSLGIIILGGPGFQENMYPGVYKLISNLSDIKVPIFTLGSGWSGSPGDFVTERLFRFNNSSRKLIDYIEKTASVISCRDYPTERVLNNNGFKNVVMTGCPAWYDLNSIGRKFIPPQSLKKIVFTPAQNSLYLNQNIQIMDYLNLKFSQSTLIVSFHRGMGTEDSHTSKSDAVNTNEIFQHAKKLGFEVLDVSYDTKKINFYDKCNMHIGYRVHAHIYFISKRISSILLHEDGRGVGVSESLNSPGIDAFKISRIYYNVFRFLKPSVFSLKLYRKLGLKPNLKIITELNFIIEELMSTEFKIFYSICLSIDSTFKVMENYILKIISLGHNE